MPFSISLVADSNGNMIRMEEERRNSSFNWFPETLIVLSMKELLVYILQSHLNYKFLKKNTLADGTCWMQKNSNHHSRFKQITIMSNGQEESSLTISRRRK